MSLDDSHPTTVEGLDAAQAERGMEILRKERYLKEGMIPIVIQFMGACADVTPGRYIVGSYEVTVEEDGSVRIKG